MASPESSSNTNQLGTFLGVFTPSILTILGVIMYLRLGWVLGQAGLIRTLFIVLIANGITFITALSVSALATNRRVGVGGDYFLLSRSLGLEIGGALGLPLFLSQALSVTLYSFGFSESMLLVFPNLNIQVLTFILVLIIGVLSAKSAQLALKIQVPLMVAVALSIGLLFAGANISGHLTTPWQSHSNYSGFWVVFAVFFPAVTGVTTGVSMSGDLKDPGKSIPRGILAAVSLSFLVYISIPIILWINASPDQLVSNSLIWMDIAKYPKLILPGLWGAILSSAIGSSLAAPRTLQALSMDRIVPAIFKKASSSGEPIIATIATITIAACAVLLGNLNAVAIVVTMFFLTSYGMANLGAAMESIIGDPSYRPRMKIPWFISLCGFLGCAWAMFLINPWACLIAVFIELGLWIYLKRRCLTATWGDLWRGYYQSLIRHSMYKLQSLPPNPRNWRPHILIFAGDIPKRLDLVQFATWFGQNRGLVTVCDLIMQNDNTTQIEDLDQHQRKMEAAIAEHGLLVFSQANYIHSFEQGVISVAGANGIAGFSSNTVMMGWNHNPDGLAGQLRIMRDLAKQHKSFILCKFKDHRIYHHTRKIVIWWGGLERNGDMMLLLAHLLIQNRDWTGSNIVLKSLANDEEMLKDTESYLARLMPEIRINAEADVILKPKDRPVQEIIRAESEGAEVVFLGLAIPEHGHESEYAQRLIELSHDMPTIIFVRNSANFLGRIIRM